MTPTLDTIAPELLFAIAEHLPLNALQTLLRCNGVLYRRLLCTLYKRAVAAFPPCLRCGGKSPWLGNARQVALCLFAGMDVNVRTKGLEFATRLHIAAEKLAIGPASPYWTRGSHPVADLEVMRLLLARGADVNAKTGYGKTPLNLLFERNWNVNWRTGRMKIDALILLLQRGADINAAARGVDSPLNCAVDLQNPRMVDFLLRHGANVHKRDCRGISPLQKAVSAGSLEMVACLLQYGADQHGTDYMGKSMLHYAAISDSPAKVTLLLNCGADVNKRDYQGTSPLIQAVKAKNPEIVRILLERGADRHQTDFWGHSSLYHAAMTSSAMLWLVL
jgi:ankyrin repeat protein